MPKLGFLHLFQVKAGGKADTVYKIKDICNGVNVSDPNELNALYAEKPEYKARLQKYLSIVHPEGVRRVFFLDDASSDINLLYPVMPKRNNSFKSFYHMADFIKGARRKRRSRENLAFSYLQKRNRIDF